jgi:predicted DNA-binding transcriptional regulator YafY
VQVRLGYSDRAGNTSMRRVHPLGLVAKGSVWYLIAGTDAGRRTFRIGRVTSVEATAEPVVRPPGFDLAEAWEQIVENVQELRASHHVDAVVDADHVVILRWMFDRQLQVLDDPDQGDAAARGRVRVRLGGQSIERIATQIAGFGNRLAVLAPDEAKECLARIGHDLVQAYGAPGAPGAPGARISAAERGRSRRTAHATARGPRPG